MGFPGPGARKVGPEGWGGQTRKKWRAQRVGAKNFALFFPSTAPIFHFLFFSLGRGLLVELWPQVVAMEHPNCAFGLLGHFV